MRELPDIFQDFALKHKSRKQVITYLEELLTGEFPAGRYIAIPETHMACIIYQSIERESLPARGPSYDELSGTDAQT